MKKVLQFIIFTSILLFAAQSFGADYIVIFGTRSCPPCQSLRSTIFEKTTYSKLTSKYRVVYVDVETEEGNVVWRKYKSVGRVKSNSVPQTYILRYNEKKKSYHIEKQRTGNLLRLDLFNWIELNLGIGR